MKDRRRALSIFVVLALFTSVPAGADDGDDEEEAQEQEQTTRVEQPPLSLPPNHKVLGVPVFTGAVEASEKTIRGLGLDAFDGYRVGVFFTNAGAMDVAMFYIRALGKTVKKEKSEETLRYVLMIEPPSGDNPLGDKVVIDETQGGVRDEMGTVYRTSIAVYRKIPKKTAAK